MSKVFRRVYNEKVESFCTRLLYFFNTVDSFFIFAGLLATFICTKGNFSVQWFFTFGVISIFCLCLSDFYPLFIPLTLPYFFSIFFLLDFPISIGLYSCFVCLVITIATQFLFMGLPDSIVGRDIKIAFVKIYNSLTTIAPTTVSVPISLFFSWSLCLSLLASQSAASLPITNSVIALLSLMIAAGITRFFKPRTFVSKFMKIPPPDKGYFKRVVLLNIDGCRMDYFKELDLPAARRLEKEGTSVENGAQTVYRALTNPAFASILTATPPTVHGVKNNNFGQSIRVQGLPDIASTILYGSMHVKHFSKDEWNTRIVSLPTTSIYGCDEVMIDWFMEDFLSRNDVRLFVLDFSEADFLGHAYGSHSQKYKDALRRVDRRIGKLVDWLRDDIKADDTAVILCSDHGMYNIDHSYLMFNTEKYVPFIIEGKGIAKGRKVSGDFSIMDIGLTVCYLLGVPYPKHSKGRVLLEAINEIDSKETQETVSRLFNKVYYDLEAKVYDESHPEIMDGDYQWYLEHLKKIYGKENREPKKILDFGCGTGFVSQILLNSKIPYQKLVCLDTSKEMLGITKLKLNGVPNVWFVQSLDEIKGETFDLIALNSVLHHLPDPGKILCQIESFLVSGGYIMGGHEPNIHFTYNPLALFAARLYKIAGGNVAFPGELVENFNQKIKEAYPGFPSVDREEIQQIVEWHSPFEQNREIVAKGVGFNGKDFLIKNLKNCNVVVYDEYTTFFKRRNMVDFLKLQSMLEVGYNIIFPGNLFRYIVCKK